MASVKDIFINRVDSKSANNFVRRWHYSGKVVNNSQLHFGAFLNKRLHGVLSFGASINKKGTKNLVSGTGWNEFVELNRMAFDDVLPKNSESRCLSVCLRLIKKHCPHIKWVISFADGTQSGHGTIYQAVGFLLVGIHKNTALRVNPKTNEPMHIIQASHKKISSREFNSWRALCGFQYKYIYFLDSECKKKLTQPILPYSKIREIGGTMYKGLRVGGVIDNTPEDHSGNGGLNPTPTLQFST